jgi:hypothetical protein
MSSPSVEWVMPLRDPVAVPADAFATLPDAAWTDGIEVWKRVVGGQYTSVCHHDRCA